MLGLDTQKQAQWRTAAAREKAVAKRQAELEHEIWSNTISVEPDGERDTSNLLAQLGRPLAALEVQRRLKLCNQNLIFEVALRHPELTGVYYEKMERNATGGWEKRKVHVCGMESGVMPEFSVLHKTKKQVANPELFGNTEATREIDWKHVDTFAAETRGWRTVLLRLMKSGLVTRGQIAKHFEWTPSQESKRWASQT